MIIWDLNMNDIMKILYQHFLVHKLPMKQSLSQHLAGKLTGNYEFTLCNRSAPYIGPGGVCGYIYPIDINIKLSKDKNNSFKMYHSRAKLIKFFVKEVLSIIKDESKIYIKKKLMGKKYNEWD